MSQIEITQEDFEKLTVSGALTLMAEWLFDNPGKSPDDFHGEGSCPIYHRAMQARNLLHLYMEDPLIRNFVDAMSDQEYDEWIKNEGGELRVMAYLFCAAIVAEMESSGEFDRELVSEEADGAIEVRLPPQASAILQAIFGAMFQRAADEEPVDKTKLH